MQFKGFLDGFSWEHLFNVFDRCSSHAPVSYYYGVTKEKPVLCASYGHAGDVEPAVVKGPNVKVLILDFNVA